jgi:heat shock protein HslJ
VFVISFAPLASASNPRQVPAFDLADTNWVLSSLDGRLPLPGAALTLQLDKDGAATGSDGCNQFRATYSRNENKLTFKQPAAGTMIACSEPVMKQSALYLNALAKTTEYMATERALILFGGNEILATFVAEAQGLSDTAWDVINFNNGRNAVVGVLPETELTALFGADGSVTGSAGCNEYVATYAAISNTIKINTPGTTLRFCAEPKGVMDQEFEFLNALASAATYNITGDVMQMRTADDQLALIMTRKTIVDLPAPKPLTPMGRVTGTQNLNIRSGPGTNYPVIGAARYGDEGEIVGRNANGDWWAVAAPSLPGGIGWVSADFVLATNAENVPVIAAPPIPPTRTPIPITPTPTPMPQATATPVAVISFGADRTSINRGECVTLNWNVQNVQGVWVYPQGEPYNRFPRTGQGSEQVCPPVTTTYEMRVLLRDGTIQFRQVTINVSQPPTAVPPTAVPPTAVPPTAVPPTAVPPTAVPPTAVPPTAVPPTAVPPTAVPPTAVPPTVNPLAGTHWNVVNFNNGKGAVTTKIEGTTITLQFDTAGQVSGNSGCNTYSASYRVSGNALSIEPPRGVVHIGGEI